MKMPLEQRRQAILQLHLSDNHFYSLLTCVFYYRFDGIDNQDFIYIYFPVAFHTFQNWPTLFISAKLVMVVNEGFLHRLCLEDFQSQRFLTRILLFPCANVCLWSHSENALTIAASHSAVNRSPPIAIMTVIRSRYHSLLCNATVWD